MSINIQVRKINTNIPGIERKSSAIRERGWPIDSIPVQYVIASTDIGIGGLLSQLFTGSPTTAIFSRASKYLFSPFAPLKHSQWSDRIVIVMTRYLRRCCTTIHWHCRSWLVVGLPLSSENWLGSIDPCSGPPCLGEISCLVSRVKNHGNPMDYWLIR